MSFLSQFVKRGAATMIGVCMLGWTSVSAAPLSLEEAINMALENHLDIKMAENEQKQAKYELKSTQGSQGLSVDASNTLYLKKVNDSASTSNSDISLSLPLYTGGKNEGNVEIAKNDVTIAELNLLKTKQDVRLKAVTAYLDVIEARKTQEVAQETVDNYQMHLDNVKAQYSAGNVAKADVLRSEVELTDAEQTLLKSKNAYEVAVNTLKNVIRWKSTEPLEFTDEFQYAPFQMAMDESVTFAKNHRPDITKYRLAIQSAEKSVDVAAADRKPSIALTAGTSWDSNVFPNPGDTDTFVGITSSWNLFDNQITKSKVKKAEIGVDTAQKELESQEDEVEVTVKEYYLTMKEAEKRQNTTQIAINKAKEDYFIAQEKYKVGEGVLLDVIDAQLALTTARNNYIQAQYDYATYKAKLENAMGMD
ncbi:putative secreted protein [Propionispora sp. 2/2-37]|uniref:TolC family protein n=1 Tax=Propionispora sp. 2/2-37 TaxID=1677858 RepID=UPI0006BB7AE8|nr:TolC family protein [Propionispora sp. 2/2-37]CUH96869.1 putative secreted protein [Propionispora sp. 2/2-37]